MIVGSTDQKFVVDVFKDISDYQEVYIMYIKPDKTTGSFLATVTNISLGIIEYEVVNATDIDIAGDWIFYAKITYTDLSIGYGQPFIKTAKNQGQL